MMPGKASGGYIPGELTETLRAAEESRTIKLAAVKEIITLRGEIAELKRENERLRLRLSWHERWPFETVPVVRTQEESA